VQRRHLHFAPSGASVIKRNHGYKHLAPPEQVPELRKKQTTKNKPQ